VNEPIVQRLNEHVVRLGTWIVNWYLLADGEGVTVIDAAVPGYRKQLEPGLRELGGTTSDVRAVVLTHGHADHVGVAEGLRTELSVPVYVHTGDEQLARTAKAFGKNESSMLPYLRHAMAYKLLFELGRNGGMKPQRIGAVETYADGDELPVPGRPRVVHTPGHTDGHCSLVAGGVLFAGDAVCTLNPLTGVRGPQLMPAAFARSSQQALASLDRLAGTGAEVLAPGHGDPVPQPDAAVDEARRRGPT
jgi:glyoxylase-like metal-dependent hydrolase (beta-lactamase superfamily II)